MGLRYSHPDSEEGLDYIEIAREAIPRDSRKSFIGAIRDQQSAELAYYGKVYTTECPSEFVRLIFQHRAVNCASSILLGEARFNVDLNVPWIDGLPPLHLAARNLSFDLTKLFLSHGAHPNLSLSSHGHGHGHGQHANIPLCLALEALRCNPCVAEWDVKKSPFKLIYILCIKQLREAVDTIKLLASRTDNLHKISLLYAEEGEVVQLTALLLVACDKLMTPYAEHGVEFSPIGQCIYKELQLLSDQQMNGRQCCLIRKSKLECAWKMLLVFGDAHHRIEEYLYFSKDAETPNYDVPLDVVSIVRGFVELDPATDVLCDDVPCLTPTLKPEEKDELRRDLKKVMNSGPPAPPASVISNNFLSAIGIRASHSFHTVSKPYFTKDLKKVPKLSSSRTLENARMCAFLFSSIKRSFK